MRPVFAGVLAVALATALPALARTRTTKLNLVSATLSYGGIFPDNTDVRLTITHDGRQVFNHPGIQGRHYILDKLSAFHREHNTGMPQVLRDLQAAVGQIPPREHAAEAVPLVEEWQKIQEGHRRGPQLLGDILPLVLARLGVGVVQSTESGE